MYIRMVSIETHMYVYLQQLLLLTQCRFVRLGRLQGFLGVFRQLLLQSSLHKAIRHVDVSYCVYTYAHSK